ncbi:hypothetical protein [Nitrososphaeria virus YSH_1032793]|uniref:Uncharacterized protein n=1 Tax=Nitrososphaeria virus YSH_1032793 TaxID=3071320 RepID=A0A976UBA2_9CAUD|nr:hypothetical protein QKV91_gp66 [Yangshan Harbor Nitrososphaeria virus]UVF62270.1 hypothetical protein [Nitrososphaeria virus YSH_1032793]
MSFTAEFVFWTQKTGGYTKRVRLPIDDLSQLEIGDVFKIVRKTSGRKVFFRVIRKSHIYYEKENEYFVEFYMKRI